MPLLKFFYSLNIVWTPLFGGRSLVYCIFDDVGNDFSEYIEMKYTLTILIFVCLLNDFSESVLFMMRVKSTCVWQSRLLLLICTMYLCSQTPSHSETHRSYETLVSAKFMVLSMLYRGFRRSFYGIEVLNFISRSVYAGDGSLAVETSFQVAIPFSIIDAKKWEGCRDKNTTKLYLVVIFR